MIMHWHQILWTWRILQASQTKKLPDYGRCLGIRCNSWAQVQWQRDVTHHLLGDGTSNIIGWGALRWQGMIGTDKVLFGKHSKL
jgi:hypothetical protein